MRDSKKYFFPLAVVCILVVIFLVRCGKGSNANNISFTTEQQEEIKTIVDHVSSWSKDLPISPARKPNKIAITQCNGKTYFTVGYLFSTQSEPIGRLSGSYSVTLRVYTLDPSFRECDKSEFDKNTFAVLLVNESRSIDFSSSQSSKDNVQQKVEDAYRAYLNNKS